MHMSELSVLRSAKRDATSFLAHFHNMYMLKLTIQYNSIRIQYKLSCLLRTKFSLPLNLFFKIGGSVTPAFRFLLAHKGKAETIGDIRVSLCMVRQLVAIHRRNLPG